MRLIRLTLWTLTAMLLLNSSGALSVLHKLSHHADEASIAQCGHGERGTHHDHADPTPEPQPIDDEDCSICLGLSGLHLVPVPDPAGVVETPMLSVLHVESARTIHARPAVVGGPARAPPVC